METYPEDLDNLVGKKCVFKIQVSDYNLNNNYHVFTELTEDESIIKELTKKYLGEDVCIYIFNFVITPLHFLDTSLIFRIFVYSESCRR